MIKTLEKDLYLFDETRTIITHVLEAGSDVLICATDNVQWIYVEDFMTETCGWVKSVIEDGIEVFIGKENTPVSEMFTMH